MGRLSPVVGDTPDLRTHIKFLIWAWMQEPRNRVFIAVCITVVIIVFISCLCFQFVRSLTKYEYSGSHHMRHLRMRRERIRDRITDAFFRELSRHSLLARFAQACRVHHDSSAEDGECANADGAGGDGEEGGNVVLSVAPPPSYQEAMSITVVHSSTPWRQVCRENLLVQAGDARDNSDLEPPPSYESVSHIMSRELVSLPSSAPNSPHVLC